LKKKADFLGRLGGAGEKIKVSNNLTWTFWVGFVGEKKTKKPHQAWKEQEGRNIKHKGWRRGGGRTKKKETRWVSGGEKPPRKKKKGEGGAGEPQLYI